MAVVQGEIWTGIPEFADTNLDQYMPFNCAWHDTRMDYIIDASELTTLGLAANYQITEIRLYMGAAPGLTPIPNVRMALKHTAKTTQPNNTYSAASDAYSTFTEVYNSSRSFTTANSFQAFVFTTPFTWNGTNNIIVSVSKDGTATSTPTGDAFRYRGTGTVRTKAYRANSTAAFPYDSGTIWLDDYAPRTYIVASSPGAGTTYTQTVGSASVMPSSTVLKRLTLTKTVGGGTITPTGSLVQNITGLAVSAGGAILTPIGSLAKRTYKGVGGVVTSIGNAAKGLFKTVGSGTVNPSGTVGRLLNPEPPSSVSRAVINWVMKGIKNFF